MLIKNGLVVFLIFFDFFFFFKTLCNIGLNLEVFLKHINLYSVAFHSVLGSLDLSL